MLLASFKFVRSQELLSFWGLCDNSKLYIISRKIVQLLMIQRKEEGESFFGIEDVPYYLKRIQEQELDLDFGVIREYFPVNLVLSGIFKICEDLFGNYAILSCILFFQVNYLLYHPSVPTFIYLIGNFKGLLRHFGLFLLWIPLRPITFKLPAIYLCGYYCTDLS